MHHYPAGDEIMWDRMPRLDARKMDILRYVVVDYVATAEPVGSRTLARKYGLGVSPATIRNEMADLEAMGLLEQPHTSAGRIPTDQGYRLFVDQLMTSISPPQKELERVRSLYRAAAREIEGRIRLTAHILSEVTEYFSVVQVPARHQTTLNGLHLVPMRGRQAVLVLVTDGGRVESRIIDLPQEMDAAELAHISQVLSSHLKGHTLGTLSRGALLDLALELAGYRAVLDQVLELLRAEETDDVDARLYASGAANLLRQPEFQDVERAHRLLHLLVGRQGLLRSLLGDPAPESSVRVVIGSENPLEGIQDCSVVTTTYAMGDGTLGQLAVIGPRRMDYSLMIAWVETVSQLLSESLSRGP